MGLQKCVMGLSWFKNIMLLLSWKMCFDISSNPGNYTLNLNYIDLTISFFEC